MKINLITLFPKIFTALNYGIVSRAQKNGLLDLAYYPLRNYTKGDSARVDDRPYGGGPGMVMKYAPLAKAIESVRQGDAARTQVVYMSPKGKPFDQKVAEKLAKKSNLIIICGRYEGIDERVIDEYVDAEYSVGDYVLSGGEIPALIVIDAVTRLLPGALGHKQSAKQDSFADGLLDYPHYTRPEVIQNRFVPDILLSGDHKAIARWRRQQSLGTTWQKRPDLLKRLMLNDEEKTLLEAYIKNCSER